MHATDPPEPGFLRRLHLRGKRNAKLYYVTPPSVWAVFVYLTSIADLRSIEDPESGFWLLAWTASVPHFDKIVHAGYYAILSLLLVRGWQREKMPPLELHALVWTMCLVFGFMIEVHQSLLPYRSFELLDLAADGAGALAGQVAWHLAMLRWGRRTRLYPGLLRPDFKDSPANPANRPPNRKRG